MTYAELLGLKKKLSDSEIIRLMSKNQELHIEQTKIKKPEMSSEGVSGDFGYVEK